jgi:predicted flavoprotein YhiN
VIWPAFPLKKAHVQIADSSFSETGPVLITHWGLSGPAVLKALGPCRDESCHEKEYRFDIQCELAPSD